MKSTKNRNYCLDFVKGIACIFVVFMHCEFPGRLGILIQCVSRFCVPFFFMVSGYFCYNEDTPINFGKKIKHIFWITCGATVLYAVLALLCGDGINSVTVKQIVYWLFFNQPIIIVGQMWFLFALLYDYILFAMIEKLKWQKLSKIYIFIGIGAYIALAQGAYLLDITISNPIYRNFLIEGFSLFSLGYWLHRDEKRFHLSNKILVIMIVVTTLLCPIERLLMGRDFGVNIITFPQVFSIFLYCIHNPQKGKNSWIMILGLKYSLYVYIFHPMVWHTLDEIYERMHVSGNILVMYLRPILCVAIAIMLSILFVNGKKFMKGRKV